MKFRKKPVVIEALKFTGTNLEEVSRFMAPVDFGVQGGLLKVYIQTLEGRMECSIGDWIIKGIKGEFYPCKPDIFEATYEAVTGKVEIEEALKEALERND